MSIDQVFPEIYQEQLNRKKQQLEQQFHPFWTKPITAFASETAHYRMRAEFKIWHEADTAYYAMYKPGEYKQPFIIESFPVASKSINQLMPTLLDAINGCDVLKKRLFQIEFLSSQSGEMVVSLLYHKTLDEHWQMAADRIANKISISIIGRSRKQKLVIGNDFVIETLHVGQQNWHYKQIESSFTQPNAGINEKMINWALQHCRNENQGSVSDLLELYCGNGNFTIPLSACFRQVLATEISKTSVNAALHNTAMNQRENISIARLSSEEISEALAGKRSFRRLTSAGINIENYDFSTVLVDPPRAGLDKTTIDLIRQFDNILYISCNPETLNKNLELLKATHAVEDFAFFDQFPYTNHCECGVKLKSLNRAHNI
ncbi:MAG: tRNA (uridine(54)-C5)-methyltransferase TrmA [Pseudomonadales bacterium]|nr:tRNA (uridine(54)-C5)-methyltransferase TrmA [Pseudomonadales bacterium]